MNGSNKSISPSFPYNDFLFQQYDERVESYKLVPMNHLRNLRPDEIATLRSQACRADDWNQVWVPEVFDIEYVNHVRFSGVVKLGAFRKVFTLPGGLVKHSGLRHVTPA